MNQIEELEFSFKDLLKTGGGIVSKIWGGIKSTGQKIAEVLKVPKNVMNTIKERIAKLIDKRNKAIKIYNSLPSEIRTKFEEKVYNLEKEYRKYVKAVNKDDREISEELGFAVAAIVLGAGVVVSLGMSLLTLLKLGQFQTAINSINAIEKEYDKLTDEMLSELEKYKSKNIQKYKQAKMQIKQKISSMPKVSGSVWDDLKGFIALGILGFLGIEYMKMARSSK